MAGLVVLLLDWLLHELLRDLLLFRAARELLDAAFHWLWSLVFVIPQSHQLRALNTV